MTDTKSLVGARKRIEDTIRKIVDAYDAMKGQVSQAATHKRARMRAALAKLRSEKDAISAKINSVTDKPADKPDTPKDNLEDKPKEDKEDKPKDGSDEAEPDKEDDEASDEDNKKEIEAVRRQLKEIVAQQKSRTSVIDDQVSAIRERISYVVGDNDALAELVSKERLSIRLKFNSAVLQLVDNPKQRDEMKRSLSEVSAKLAKATKGFDDVLKKVDSKFGKSDKVKKAKSESDDRLRKADEKEADMETLRKELEKNPDSDRADAVRQKLDSIQKDVEATPEGDKKSSDPAVKKLRDEIASLKSDQDTARKNTSAPGKDGSKNRDAVDILEIQIKKKEADLEKLLNK